jgi:hypothetical protein
LSQITVQLKNTQGEVVEEKEIVVRKGDTLVMQFPDEMRLDHAHSVYKTLLNALENPTTGLIGIPDKISFQVISVKEA